ncbi:hypothetical protein WJX72_005254 [[Myrmecia] bisecta]|uniref:Uncharacterized protein n=1 Tax=[Myrmecia] bisecta TaxID=41462 RepID=A0AAW1P6H3_9CHLO
MGLWTGPSSPCKRHIDLKVYPNQQLACAVCHFTSGTWFCRSLRHWCNAPQPHIADLARRLHPEANAFHLNDSTLCPVWRVPFHLRKRKDGSRKRQPTEQEARLLELVPPGGKQVVLGPAIACRIEPDIFKAVGLAYVPPAMRDMQLL